MHTPQALERLPYHLVPAMYNTVDVAIHSREWMPPSRKMHGFSAEFPASLISRTSERRHLEGISYRCSISKVPQAYLTLKKQSPVSCLRCLPQNCQQPFHCPSLPYIFSKNMLLRHLQRPSFPGATNLTCGHQSGVLLR